MEIKIKYVINFKNTSLSLDCSFFCNKFLLWHFIKCWYIFLRCKFLWNSREGFFNSATARILAEKILLLVYQTWQRSVNIAYLPQDTRPLSSVHQITSDLPCLFARVTRATMFDQWTAYSVLNPTYIPYFFKISTSPLL